MVRAIVWWAVLRCLCCRIWHTLEVQLAVGTLAYIRTCCTSDIYRRIYLFKQAGVGLFVCRDLVCGAVIGIGLEFFCRDFFPSEDGVGIG
jgi:hypothetical protein